MVFFVTGRAHCLENMILYSFHPTKLISSTIHSIKHNLYKRCTPQGQSIICNSTCIRIRRMHTRLQEYMHLFLKDNVSPSQSNQYNRSRQNKTQQKSQQLLYLNSCVTDFKRCWRKSLSASVDDEV